ncbi:MAG TPA: F0F1 ATP synthase subunit A [Deltaproteobacteria bacterium]|nr:F0F1 ATP synthase subunit A [Deltaproteobacteria bacterium]HPJ93657.1 F0F1 ATP synthase subunit A [Deltaproteobacteria bacterium]HPR50603.1 F0F1 ATP synthase subunit A [Deltaproteobacteria bacterium]
MEILSLNQISPDQVILWQWGIIKITATLLYTWFIMGILIIGSWLVTRNISSEVRTSRWQGLLEVVVSTIRNQIKEISPENPGHYLAFIGTLFLFVGLSNLLLIVPGYVAPTSSLTTTAALAICVFIAVPLYGITKQGIKGYFKEYFQPTFIFFPFHVMGEATRTLALAVRLFGNMMSHDKVIAILLAVTPLFFPIIMHALGLLIGLVQAYIFAILAMVYIASAAQAHEDKGDKGA